MRAPKATPAPQLNVNIRFPPPLLEQIRVLAAKDMRSINGEVIWLLTRTIEAMEAPEPSSGNGAS
jgi:hypothetical protein